MSGKTEGLAYITTTKKKLQGPRVLFLLDLFMVSHKLLTRVGVRVGGHGHSIDLVGNVCHVFDA